VRQAPGHAVARIAFRARPDGSTGLADLYQAAPLRVLRPRPLEANVAEAVMANVGGGLVGGDRLDLSVALEEGANALVTSQAAEKVYRSLGADVVARTHLRVAPGATLEWLPQEAILFDGARLDRRTRIDVEAGGRLIAAESLVFGRGARGERFARGRLVEAWRVNHGGGAVWGDALVLDDPPLRAIDHGAGLAGAGAVSTLIYVGDDASAHLDAARALLDKGPCRAAATLVAGILVARIMDRDATQVRAAFKEFAGGFRAVALGRAAGLPRVWNC
jgi:urease accessory protein